MTEQSKSRLRRLLDRIRAAVRKAISTMTVGG